ncbi:MAG: hypothetical protein HY951_07895 [Bacteroidia bacterium]|nr:hypothetical protein [Bacteroidia bacterium]
MKNLLTTSLLIIAINFLYSQTMTVEDAKKIIKGTWHFVYEKEVKIADTYGIIDKITLKINHYKGSEIGIMKDGKIIKNKIKVTYALLGDSNELMLIFKKSLWFNDQNFIVKKIEKDKISLQNCIKGENCNNVYLIRE